MQSNPLFEKATASETAKLVAALIKLVLALYAGPTAIALGAFLEKVVLTKVEAWDGTTETADEVEAIAAHVPVPDTKLGIHEILSFFGIKAIEVEHGSLVRLLETGSWVSAIGGVSMLRLNQELLISDWYSPIDFPAALANSTMAFVMKADVRLVVLRFPAARRNSEPVLLDVEGPASISASTVVQSAMPGEAEVVLAITYLPDIREKLKEAGIALVGEESRQGLEVVLDTVSNGHTLKRRKQTVLLNTVAEGQ